MVPTAYYVLMAASCSPETGLSSVTAPSRRPLPGDVVGQSLTDTFVTHKPHGQAVDVLWLPEGSGSMQEELELIRPHIPAFMVALDSSSADYRVGVVHAGIVRSYFGTLVGVGAYRWVDRDTLDPVSTFVEMMAQATDEATSFQGLQFDGAHTCLGGPDGDCIRYGFRRDSAPIHAVVITDEEDRSEIGKDDFVRFYQSLTDSPDDRTFSGILDTSQTPSYVAASREIGGVVVDVRDGDYHEVLAQFADMIIASAEQKAHHLTCWADEDTLVVRVLGGGPDYDPVPAETTWRYDPVENAVLIPTEALPEGAFEVAVTYDVRSDGW